jgi:myo-inositol-1(or 4)-monophosphatase
MSPTDSRTAVRYCSLLQPAELAEFRPALQALIDVSGEVVKRYFLQHPDVITKSDASPVTAADRGAEEAMRQWLTHRYPDHGVLGEEYGETPAAPGRTRYRWVLDPVDGTRAFISNCFLFGTLIALERDDGEGFRPVLGAIAHPAAGVAVLGHAGGSTLLAADGSERAARVRRCADLAEATLLATSHWSVGEQRDADGVDRIEHLARATRMYRTWGDCFGYFSLATGGADIMLDPVCAYWDVAALIPVLEGAGAAVTSWAGGNPLQAPSLIATVPELMAPVLRTLGRVPSPD